MKKAFTLIELILVIVILAIVAGMTLNLVFVIYKNYVQSESISRVGSQADIILDQISKRLEYRIRSSDIARNSSDNSILNLNDSGLNSSYNILEFIPYSYEAFDLGVYSGIVDMDNSNTTNGSIETPGSNLDTSLFDQISPRNKNKELAMIFRGVNYNVDSSFGYTGANVDFAKVKFKDLTHFNNDISFVGKQMSEQYYLAHTAYAIVVTKNDTSAVSESASNRDFDLVLYYDYRPWLGQQYNQGSSTVLARHVSMFKFKEENGMVFLKLCLRDNQKQRSSLSKSGFDFNVCRTKAVF
ncbi:prepilin-type N-terminal cleavage/methylation domain-containing protein [Campylobacter pinnipediorum]|uniref:prepilin-type N-terminal cleavage/methylation domain-containing protein n=1 Tax=Campylobacter pinnipediorum TaxID=1965231 RepID=UPI00084D7534|nr:prepilin-type N-terminal cleavage/methylation domain-containing protein [Campylobacter pinnipediorum]